MKLLKTLISLFVCLALAGCGDYAQQIKIIVGTYTGEGPNDSKGLYSYTFNTKSGTAQSDNTCAELPDASFVTICGDKLYAVSELAGEAAAVAAFEYNAANGSFRTINSSATFSGGPCHVATNGKFVIASNYGGGSVTAFKIEDDGSLSEACAQFPGLADGPDASRQSTPHVHCSAFTPDGKYVFATDFSSDRLMRLELGDNISSNDISYEVDPGTGPRHMVFNASGDRLYVIGEISGAVTVFDYNDGKLNRRQIILADKVNARGAADIHFSPDGKFLYCSCRLENDGIAIFKVLEDGSLEDAGYFRTGIHPRNFAISPDGKWLLCACRDSDMIQILRRDKKTGALSDTGNKIKLSKPVCVQFYCN
ncbi:MAG: lactonase family protein [Bacteroidales bacterium]|nr:lactonase family protein [Bacteroidales bacterium]